MKWKNIVREFVNFYILVICHSWMYEITFIKSWYPPFRRSWISEPKNMGREFVKPKLWFVKSWNQKCGSWIHENKNMVREFVKPKIWFVKLWNQKCDSWIRETKKYGSWISDYEKVCFSDMSRTKNARVTYFQKEEELVWITVHVVLFAREND